MSDRHEAEAAGRCADAYLETVKRMEPDITPVDQDGAAASIAISLKRIADSLEHLPDAISNALFDHWRRTNR